MTLTRQLPYYIPVQAIGTQYEISPGDFQIARLSISNPSQCWLFLSQINIYVPPQTLSRVVSISPTQSRILVSFVAAPTGGVPSAATGDPVQIIAYETDAPDVAGTDFGLLPAVIDLTTAIETLNDTMNNMRTGNGPLAQTEYQTSIFRTLQSAGGGVSQLGFIASPGAGLRIYVTRLTCSIVLTGLYGDLAGPYDLISIPGTFNVSVNEGATPLIRTNSDNPEIRVNAGAVFGSLNTALDLDIFCTEGQTVEWSPTVIVEWYAAA